MYGHDFGVLERGKSNLCWQNRDRQSNLLAQEVIFGMIGPTLVPLGVLSIFITNISTTSQIQFLAMGVIYGLA